MVNIKSCVTDGAKFFSGLSCFQGAGQTMEKWWKQVPADSVKVDLHGERVQQKSYYPFKAALYDASVQVAAGVAIPIGTLSYVVGGGSKWLVSADKAGELVGCTQAMNTALNAVFYNVGKLGYHSGRFVVEQAAKHPRIAGAIAGAGIGGYLIRKGVRQWQGVDIDPSFGGIKKVKVDKRSDPNGNRVQKQSITRGPKEKLWDRLTRKSSAALKVAGGSAVAVGGALPEATLSMAWNVATSESVQNFIGSDRMKSVALHLSGGFVAIGLGWKVMQAVNPNEGLLARARTHAIGVGLMGVGVLAMASSVYGASVEETQDSTQVSFS